MCEVGRVIGCGLLSFIQFGNVAVWNTFGYFALRHSNLVRADVWLRRLPTRQRFVNGIGKRYLLPTPSEQIIVPVKESQWPSHHTPTATPQRIPKYEFRTWISMAGAANTHCNR